MVQKSTLAENFNKSMKKSHCGSSFWKCAKITEKSHWCKNHWEVPLLADLLRGLLVCPPTDQYDGTGAIPRGGPARPDAHQPTAAANAAEMVALQRATSNVRGAGSMLHSKSRYAPQSADSEQLIPTLRDLASRAHRWEAQLLFNLKEAAQMWKHWNIG